MTWHDRIGPIMPETVFLPGKQGGVMPGARAAGLNRSTSPGGKQTVLDKKTAELEEALGDQEKYFAKLLDINLHFIEEYYSLAGEQAGKSYKLTLWAAVAGFSVLLVGLTMSSLSGLGIGPFSALEARPQAVILGSGAVIEFISVIFFVLYNRTIRQLNSSHEKLVQLQDVILALRAAQSISKEHLGLYNETMRHLAEMLMVSRRSPVEDAASTGGAGAQESPNGAAGGARPL